MLRLGSEPNFDMNSISEDQLELLCSDEFFNDDSLKGSLIFDSFEHVIELSVTYRQNNDRQFSDIIERVVYGGTPHDDYNTLSARRYNILDQKEQVRFNDAIYIFPTNYED